MPRGAPDAAQQPPALAGLLVESNFFVFPEEGRFFGEGLVAHKPGTCPATTQAHLEATKRNQEHHNKQRVATGTRGRCGHKPSHAASERRAQKSEKMQPQIEMMCDHKGVVLDGWPKVL